MATPSYSHVSGPACHLNNDQATGLFSCFKTQVEKSGIPNLQAVKGITEGRTGQNMTNVCKDPNLKNQRIEAWIVKPLSEGCVNRLFA